MDPSPPLGRLRDSVSWPVLPVTAPLPLRRTQDLEPFTVTEQARAEPARVQREEAKTTESPPESPDGISISDQADHSTLASLMTSEVVAISPDASVAELEALLHEHRISGVPVVDPASGDLLGVASQADVIRHFCGPGTDLASSADGVTSYHQTLWFDLFATPIPADRKETPVRDIMTPYVYFATESATIEEALDLMLEHRIHRVVVTRQQRLVGVVTSMDLLRSYRSSLTTQSRLSQWDLPSE